MLRKLVAFERAQMKASDTAEQQCWLGIASMCVAPVSGARMALIDRAITYFENALRLDPRHNPAHVKLLGAYGSKEDRYYKDLFVDECIRWGPLNPDKVTPELQRMYAERGKEIEVPRSTQEAIAKSQKLGSEGKLTQIIFMLDKSIERFGIDAALTGRLSNTLCNRGYALAQMGYAEKAFSDFVRATEVDPKNWHAQRNTFVYADQRGEFDLALRCAYKAIGLNSSLKTDQQFVDRLHKLETLLQSLNPNGSVKPMEDVNPLPAKSSVRGKKWWLFWR
jgi:tetratricopeptide (TPR) repeat protein